MHLLCTDSGSEVILLAAAKGSLPTFNMTAYTGVPMRFPQYFNKVIVDLETLKLAAAQTPALREHDPDRIVGHGDVTITPQRVRMNGVISGVGADAQEIAATAANKFPWQASIRVDLEQPPEFIEPGKKVTVNGRSWMGPLLVARDAVLKEASFAPMGRDGASTVTISASDALLHEGRTMEFNAWLTSKGFDEAALTEVTKASLKASFDAENELAALKASAGNKPSKEDPASDSHGDTNPDWLKATRARDASEVMRSAKIRELLASDQPVVCARAIQEGWSVERAELAQKDYELNKLRASRGHNPGIPSGQAPLDPLILEAAICQQRRLPIEEYSEQVLEAAYKRFREGMDCHQMLLMAAADTGYQVGIGMRVTQGNLKDVLEYAFMPARTRSLYASSSTISLPGILGNIAKKEALVGYMEEDQTWREVFGIKSVTDFKQVTAYRLLDDSEYEELGPNGEIKHGTLGEESYTRQVKTYGKMYGLSRTSIINNDLDGFDDLRNRLGRGSSKKVNKVSWGCFIDNSTFFTTLRTNYTSGATTNLGTDGVGLGLAVLAFRKMTSPTKDGSKKVGAEGAGGGRPKILLVPPELESNAEKLYVSSNLNTGTAAGEENIYRNKYKPTVAWQLSDSAYTGNSTTAYYLLKDPKSMPTVVVSFLNGQEMPTVESAQADFNTLGIQMRGYHDFGADKAEYLGGLKVKGAA